MTMTMLRTSLVLLLVALGALACRRREPEPPVPRTIEQAVVAHADSLKAIPGVVDLTLGELRGTRVIRIHIRNTDPALIRRLPRTLDGFPVELVVSAPIRNDQQLKDQ